MIRPVEERPAEHVLELAPHNKSGPSDAGMRSDGFNANLPSNLSDRPLILRPKQLAAGYRSPPTGQRDTNCCRLLEFHRSKLTLLENCTPRASFSRANLAYPRPAALRSRGERSFTVKARFMSHLGSPPPTITREHSRSSQIGCRSSLN